MNILDKIIKKLASDVEPDTGHIELENVSEEERNHLFEKFGEGNADLTTFLRTAYNHNAPSLFCCSGHGVQSAYVVLKVNDNNIELLRKLGKVLSGYGIVTNFTNDHINGLMVDYRAIKNDPTTEWLDLASKIIEHPEKFDDYNPTIYYHETIQESNKPLLFDLKKKLLSYLRAKEQKALNSRKRRYAKRSNK